MQQPTLGTKTLDVLRIMIIFAVSVGYIRQTF
jgi:hypothetical protein